MRTDDPFALFQRWFGEARAAEAVDPNAMALATVSPEGAPSLRIVLLKGVDDRGFVFYTNLGSRKAAELQANPNAALCFLWKSLGRQVRVEGVCEPVSDTEADNYFASRPRGSQIGAWASKQSQPLPERSVLELRVADFENKFEGGDVPRPDFWSGFRLVPARFEFWHGQPSRLHDRMVYVADGNRWSAERLYP